VEARQVTTGPGREKRPTKWVAPAAVGALGLGLLWVMWLSGGSFWPLQRPFLPVTLVCAAVMIIAVMLAVAAARGPLRWLSSVAAVLAALATFLGEGLADRGRFEDLRPSLAREVEAVAKGGDCQTACRVESRAPLRVAFLFSGEGAHWSGACYDATDMIHGVEYSGRVRPPNAVEAPILAEASKLFDGQVRHAPAWGDHWYGCSTRP